MNVFHVCVRVWVSPSGLLCHLSDRKWGFPAVTRLPVGCSVPPHCGVTEACVSSHKVRQDGFTDRIFVQMLTHLSVSCKKVRKHESDFLLTVTFITFIMYTWIDVRCSTVQKSVIHIAALSVLLIPNAVWCSSTVWTAEVLICTLYIVRMWVTWSQCLLESLRDFSKNEAGTF